MPNTKKPTVIITGADGFLGTQLVNHFSKKGWRVIGLVQDPQKLRSQTARYLDYDLAKPFDETMFKGADYLVHTAYIKYDRKHPDAMKINIAAASRLARAAKKYKLKKCLFMSSMSAHTEAESVYGKQKLAIEEIFSSPQAVAVRSGMIIGDGGIVKQMVGFMKSKRIVPLVGGGKQPLQIIAVYDLVQVIEKLLTSRTHGTLTIATPQVYTYKQFYQAIAKRLGIKVVFVPVPFPLLLGMLKAISLLPLPISISADNALGLKHLKSADTAKDLKKLGIHLDSLDTALKKTLKT